jgi:hypothetical protein
MNVKFVKFVYVCITHKKVMIRFLMYNRNTKLASKKAPAHTRILLSEMLTIYAFSKSFCMLEQIENHVQ